MATTDRRLTSAHEAGHVAAAWMLLGEAGITGEASIERELALDGYTETGTGFEPGERFEVRRRTLLGEVIESDLRDRIETAVIVTMAGTLAELDAGDRGVLPPPTPPEPGSPAAVEIERRVTEAEASAAETGVPMPAGDLADERSLIEAMTIGPEEAAAYRTVLLARAQRLSASRLFRLLVDALGPALVERERLSRPELIGLIRATTGITETEGTAMATPAQTIAEEIAEITRQAAEDGWTPDHRLRYLDALARQSRAKETWVNPDTTPPIQ